MSRDCYMFNVQFQRPIFVPFHAGCAPLARGGLPMLPEGYILTLIRKYNKRLLYWDILLIALCVFPTLHQSGKPDYIANWDYLVLSAFIMAALTNLVKFLIWNSKPVLHPLCKLLGKYGDPEEIIQAVDMEAEKAGIGPDFQIFVTGEWIVYQGLLHISLIPLSEAVWLYEKGPRARGSKSSLIIFTNDGRAHLLKCGPARKGRTPAAEISFKAPWAFSGYSEKLASRWKKNRREMVDAAAAAFKKFLETGN